MWSESEAARNFASITLRMDVLLRILHVNSYMLAGKFYRHMYSAQARAGHELTVYVPVEKKGLSGDPPDLGFPADVSPTFNTFQRLSYFGKQRVVLRDAIRRYGHERFDLLHAHSLFANGNVAMQLSRRIGAPFVVAVRGTDVNTFFARMPHLRFRGVEILRSAASVVFISESARREVLSLYVPKKYRQVIAAKSRVIPNGVDQYWLDRSPVGLRSGVSGKLKLVQVGDINTNKDPASSASAVSLLGDLGVPAELTVIGKPRERKLVEQLAELTGVAVIPFMDREQLRHQYLASDVMVLPSVHETFGLVYAEALSQGLPIVYTRGQGFDGQFNEGEVGYSARARTPSDIASAVIRIRDRYAEISTRCLEVAPQFGWDRIVQMYDELYVRAVL